MKAFFLLIILFFCKCAGAMDSAGIKYCKKRHGHHACNIVFSVQAETKIYAEPSVNAKVISQTGLAQAMQADWKKTNKGPQGWVFLVVNNNQSGWALSEYFVNKRDFKKVVNCWPFSSLEDGMDGRLGDAAFSLDMKKNGAFVSKHDARYQGHVWGVGNIVFLGMGKYALGAYGMYYEDKKIYQPEAGGYFLDSVGVFPEKAMVGCESGLKFAR